MNIFALDLHPPTAAQYHIDKHVVKMITEYAQILSTAVQLSIEERIDDLYKPCYENHPCVKWAAESSGNFYWLVKLGIALSNEYTFRYGKFHASSEIIYKCAKLNEVIPWGPLMPFVQCMPDNCKMTNSIYGYREYYRQCKTAFASWTSRDCPNWYFNKAKDEIPLIV